MGRKISLYLVRDIDSTLTVAGIVPPELGNKDALDWLSSGVYLVFLRSTTTR